MQREPWAAGEGGIWAPDRNSPITALHCGRLRARAPGRRGGARVVQYDFCCCFSAKQRAWHFNVVCRAMHRLCRRAVSKHRAH
jgi:hypothetical protein